MHCFQFLFQNFVQVYFHPLASEFAIFPMTIAFCRRVLYGANGMHVCNFANPFACGKYLLMYVCDFELVCVIPLYCVVTFTFPDLVFIQLLYFISLLSLL